MEARSRAIDEKRRRLEEMKKRKAAREAESKAAAPEQAAASDKAAELRSYVDGLLAQPPVPPESAKKTAATTTGDDEETPDPAEDEQPSTTTAVIDVPPPPPPPPPSVELYDQSTQTLTQSSSAGEEEEPAAATEEEDEEEVEEEEPPVVPVDTGNLAEFLSQSSRLVERCLGERRVFDALRESEGHLAAREKRLVDQSEYDGELCESMGTCFDAEKWCAGRMVTALQWSTHRPDVLLAAYSRGAGKDDDYDGSVLLWSMARPAAPETVFSCQSSVLCATWDATNPSVLVGGTYSGQVALWDVRSPSTLPVQRSPLDAENPHTRAVSCIRAVGEVLTTASSDGVVCYWSAAQLQRPVDSQKIVDASLPVPITAMELGDASNETAELLVGCERGEVYGTRCGRGASADRTDELTRFATDESAHFGSVTTLRAHPSSHLGGQRDADSTGLRRSLVLSCSVDWTAKLWTSHEQGRHLATFEHRAHEYVCDAQWSPTRASVFATATSAGDLSLWRATNQAQTIIPPVQVAQNAALTRIAWSDDSRRIACGDSSGATRLLKLNEALVATDLEEEASLDELLAEN